MATHISKSRQDSNQLTQTEPGNSEKFSMENDAWLSVGCPSISRCVVSKRQTSLHSHQSSSFSAFFSLASLFTHWCQLITQIHAKQKENKRVTRKEECRVNICILRWISVAAKKKKKLRIVPLIHRRSITFRPFSWLKFIERFLHSSFIPHSRSSSNGSFAPDLTILDFWLGNWWNSQSISI